MYWGNTFIVQRRLDHQASILLIVFIPFQVLAFMISDLSKSASSSPPRLRAIYTKQLARPIQLGA